RRRERSPGSSAGRRLLHLPPHPNTLLVGSRPHLRCQPAGGKSSSLKGSVCGSFVDVPVKLHKGAHNGKKAGKLLLPANATAGSGTTPGDDRDTYVLECLPSSM